MRGLAGHSRREALRRGAVHTVYKPRPTALPAPAAERRRSPSERYHCDAPYPCEVPTRMLPHHRRASRGMGSALARHMRQLPQRQPMTARMCRGFGGGECLRTADLESRPRHHRPLAPGYRARVAARAAKCLHRPRQSSLRLDARSMDECCAALCCAARCCAAMCCAVLCCAVLNLCDLTAQKSWAPSRTDHACTQPYMSYDDSQDCYAEVVAAPAQRQPVRENEWQERPQGVGLCCCSQGM